MQSSPRPSIASPPTPPTPHLFCQAFSTVYSVCKQNLQEFTDKQYGHRIVPILFHYLSLLGAVCDAQQFLIFWQNCFSAFLDEVLPLLTLNASLMKKG
jgi:lipid-A-disaccharide synthase-like uncharacterized protein